MLGQEHGRLIEHQHATRLAVLLAVLAQLLGRAHDRQQRLGGRPQTADLRGRVEVDPVALEDLAGALTLGAPADAREGAAPAVTRWPTKRFSTT